MNWNVLQVLQDELGHWSSARTLLWLWSAFSLWLVATTGRELPNPVLAFLRGVEIALIVWAAGPRIAQYLAPQVSAASTAVAQALRHAVAKRRDPVDGVEVTK